MKRMTTEQLIERTENGTFGLLALLFLGTLFFILGASLGIYTLGRYNQKLEFLAGILLFAGFTIYYYLLIIFSAYGILKLTKSFKKFYKKYITVLAGIFVIVLLYLIYSFLDGMKGIIGFISTVVAGVLIFLITRGINSAWSKRKKQRR